VRVAIVGGSPLTRDLAPYDDSEWQIWVLGNQIDRYADKKADLVFEIHENLQEHGDPENYLEFVSAYGAPLVVSGAYSKWGEVYPYEAVNELMGGEYLTSSPAYMIGYAILKGAREIAIYGVEMSIDDHEYFKQRPAMYAWIGYCKGLGIKITIPEKSGLFKENYCEGRDWNSAIDNGVFSEDSFVRMEQRHREKIDELNQQIGRHDGAAQVYKNLQKVARAYKAGANVELVGNLAVK